MPPRTNPQSVIPGLRQLNGERRRRADGDHDGTAGDGRLLHELEREAPADAQNRAREREHFLAERPADDLVHRVVSTDVLAQAEKLPVDVEEAGGMEAAGRLEGRLRLA